MQWSQTTAVTANHDIVASCNMPKESRGTLMVFTRPHPPNGPCLGRWTSNRDADLAEISGQVDDRWCTSPGTYCCDISALHPKAQHLPRARKVCSYKDRGQEPFLESPLRSWKKFSVLATGQNTQLQNFSRFCGRFPYGDIWHSLSATLSHWLKMTNQLVPTGNDQLAINWWKQFWHSPFTAEIWTTVFVRLWSVYDCKLYANKWPHQNFTHYPKTCGSQTMTFRRLWVPILF